MPGDFSNRLKNIQRRFANWLPAARAGVSDWGRSVRRRAAANGKKAEQSFASIVRDVKANPTRPKYLVVAAAVVISLSVLVYGLARPGGAPGALLSGPAGNVDRVVITDASGQSRVVLRRTGKEWAIETLHDAPADAAKVARFLTGLMAEKTKVEADAITGATGLEAGEGVTVRLAQGDRGIAELTVGLHPPGRFDQVYVRTAGEPGLSTISRDLRGEMGLWRNAADAPLRNQVWMKTRVFSFDPDAVAEVEVNYPDHEIVLRRNAAGGWDMSTYAPGGEWNPAAVEPWLRDMAKFEVVDALDADALPPEILHTSTHFLRLVMKNGDIETVAANPSAEGDGMWVESSQYPGRIFLLPAWRFTEYFQPLSALFPEVAPSFAQDDIRVVVIRRDGDSFTMIRRRDNTWQAVAQPFPLRRETAALLTRTLAGWRPKDFADIGQDQVMPVQGDPHLEVILDDGSVHHYRLGEKHPVFPWRYVLVDGETLLSASEDEAKRLFPEFADILDMGAVFPGITSENVRRMEFADAATGDAFLTLDVNADGTWFATTRHGVTPLDETETRRLVQTPLAWRVAGALDEDVEDQKRLFRFGMHADGAAAVITVLQPNGDSLPFLSEGRKPLLLARRDFFAWFAAVQQLGKRMEPAPAPATPAAADSAPEQTENNGPETAPATPDTEAEVVTAEPISSEETALPADTPEESATAGGGDVAESVSDSVDPVAVENVATEEELPAPEPDENAPTDSETTVLEPGDAAFEEDGDTEDHE